MTQFDVLTSRRPRRTLGTHECSRTPSLRGSAGNRGELVVKLSEPRRHEGYSLHHVSESRCYPAMSLSFVACRGKNKNLISGPSGGYVYVITEDESDLLAAKRIFAKSESPGKLILCGRKAKPTVGFAIIVDVSPLGNSILETYLVRSVLVPSKL